MPYKDPDEARAKHREYQRKRREANPQEQRDAQKRYLERHRAEVLQRRRDIYLLNAEESRAKGRAKYKPETAAAYYEANKARINARVKAYRIANPEATKARNRAWFLANRDRKLELDRKWRRTHKIELDALRVARMRALKREVWEHYGGALCACCGSAEFEFLSIDHINGGGMQHRKALKLAGTPNIYRWLKANHYPQGYQVLCMNCNFARGMYGRCPHQQE